MASENQVILKSKGGKIVLPKTGWIDRHPNASKFFTGPGTDKKLEMMTVFGSGWITPVNMVL